jgi:hypothetical protein
MPCCKNSEKDVLGFWKMKKKNGKVCEKREIVHEK